MLEMDFYFVVVQEVVGFISNNDFWSFGTIEYHQLPVTERKDEWFYQARCRFSFCSNRLLMIEALAASIPKNIQAISVGWVLAFTLFSR